MSEKYQILARKYRPQIFKEVVGQDNIVQTIKNAIRLKRVANAYLFSGTRGTGKTTLARLFAKTLNCNNLSKDFEPCNKCTSCTEISSSRSLDVIEIDGASNRGIDDIRQINDTIGYSPSGNYKIYIIDEVHMLTKEAFNALLKTLEEPPEKIKFFFATTEPHKVLATIVSRCQRFELKRISTNLMIQKLDEIAQDLKREIDKDALFQIASFSEGSLRDAESLLDQIFCYSDEKITINYINKALGFTSFDYFFELDQKIKEKNRYFAFEFADKIHSSGKDLIYFVEELTQHFKNLLIIKLNEHGLNFLSKSFQNKYLESSKNYTEAQLFYILDLLTHKAQIKNSFKKIHLETLILKIIKSKNIIPIDILVKRLIDLEKSVKIPNTKKEENTQKEEDPKKTEKILDTKESASQKNQSNELEKVSFDLSSKNVQEIKTTSKDQAHFDTLVRFTQVELEAINKS